MKDKRKNMQIVLFLAAVWGGLEASLGYVLHFLPPGFSGMIMFPVAFWLMYNAWRRTGSRSAVLMMGVIAAALKCADLLLPLRSAMSVINPVTSILLESLAVFAIVKALEKRHIVLPVFAAGLLWISAFTFIQAVVLRPPAGLWLQPLSVQAGTVLLTAGVSTVFISLYLIRRTETVPRPLPAMHGFALPALALGTALALELLNSLI